MSKSEDYLTGLTDNEKNVFIVFDVIDHPGGTPREAREEISRKLHIRPPHRTTITPVFRVGLELFREDPTVLTDQGINEIIKKVGYGIPPSKVIELHRLYQLWKAYRREEGMPEELPALEEPGAVGIEFAPETDLGYIQYEDLPVVRKFACVRVVARRGTARCCEGTLKVVAAEDARKQFPPELKLQWFNEPYNEAVKSVDIITSEQLCVVFTEIPAGQIVKRPDRGVVIYPPLARAIAPDKIPACPSSRQWVKLDILPIRVIGRRESMAHSMPPREGAWIGTPMALNGIAHQDYLPPGQYDIKVRVRCDDGGDEERFFRVQSPRRWHDLSMRKLVGLPEVETPH